MIKLADIISLTTLNEPGFKTDRKDKWWIKPLLQATFFSVFVIYSMAMVIFGASDSKYETYKYVSPLFDPEVHINGWPDYLSPALILIWAPVGFRATCYYARKVYYRAFFADPPACAVGELRKVDHKYKGENKWPYIINNLHRYFWYLAVILAVFHWFSLFKTFYIDGSIQLGLGNIILAFDAIFLTLYTISCHACKHLVGGGLDCISCKPGRQARYKSWKIVKKLNENHHAYFWLSLATVIIGDLYIRLLSMGIISNDWRLIG